MEAELTGTPYPRIGTGKAKKDYSWISGPKDIALTDLAKRLDLIPTSQHPQGGGKRCLWITDSNLVKFSTSLHWGTVFTVPLFITYIKIIFDKSPIHI